MLPNRNMISFDTRGKVNFIHIKSILLPTLAEVTQKVGARTWQVSEYVVFRDPCRIPVSINKLTCHGPLATFRQAEAAKNEARNSFNCLIVSDTTSHTKNKFQRSRPSTVNCYIHTTNNNRTHHLLCWEASTIPSTLSIIVALI